MERRRRTADQHGVRYQALEPRRRLEHRGQRRARRGIRTDHGPKLIISDKTTLGRGDGSYDVAVGGTGTRTLVFTDLVASTELLGRLGDEGADCLLPSTSPPVCPAATA
jgi:class 3 adenylate cyclase